MGMTVYEQLLCEVRPEVIETDERYKRSLAVSRASPQREPPHRERNPLMRLLAVLVEDTTAATPSPDVPRPNVCATSRRLRQPDPHLRQRSVNKPERERPLAPNTLHEFFALFMEAP